MVGSAIEAEKCCYHVSSAGKGLRQLSETAGCWDGFTLKIHVQSLSHFIYWQQNFWPVNPRGKKPKTNIMQSNYYYYFLFRQNPLCQKFNRIVCATRPSYVRCPVSPPVSELYLIELKGLSWRCWLLLKNSETIKK